MGIKGTECISSISRAPGGSPESRYAGVRRIPEFGLTTGVQEVVVILIEFQDVKHHPSRGVTYFNELIFSTTNPFSLYSYYREVSYGQMSISGTVAGWYTSKYNMAYYGADGSEIDNANCKRHEIAREAVLSADTDGFDFSKYDKNLDGYVDHIIIVHAGPGQETFNHPYGSDAIWSHHWAISPPEVVDGVRVGDYSMVAEYSPIGTIAHEFGHDLGLPDLYDHSFRSNGIGVWGLMGYGSWLMGGRMPAHLCAWSKVWLGWVEPKVVPADEVNIALDCVEHSDTILKVPISSYEYLLIENRQRVGFDKYLPGDGILIWHIVDSVGDPADNNVNENIACKRVDLEEADGHGDLDRKVNYGDSSDPYYIGNNSIFTFPMTALNADMDIRSFPHIKVMNISSSSITMTLDVSICPTIQLALHHKTGGSERDGPRYSSASMLPKITLLGQNYPNPFNPRTWIPYQLKEDSEVVINIYAETGQLVRTLDLGYKQAGFYTDVEESACWDGRDDLGQHVADGVYFYQLRAGGDILIRKMTLLSGSPKLLKAPG